MTDPKLDRIGQTFGGEKGEEYNVLLSAITVAAGGKGKVYDFLEHTPKTTMSTLLVDAIHSLGYKISKQ